LKPNVDSDNIVAPKVSKLLDNWVCQMYLGAYSNWYEIHKWFDFSTALLG